MFFRFIPIIFFLALNIVFVPSESAAIGQKLSPRKRFCAVLIAEAERFAAGNLGGTGGTRRQEILLRMLKSEHDNGYVDREAIFPIAMSVRQISQYWQALDRADRSYGVRVAPITPLRLTKGEKSREARGRVVNAFAAAELGMTISLSLPSSSDFFGRKGAVGINLFAESQSTNDLVGLVQKSPIDPEISFFYGTVIARFHSLIHGDDSLSRQWLAFIKTLMAENPELYRQQFLAAPDKVRESYMRGVHGNADVAWRRFTAEKITYVISRRIAWEGTLEFYTRILLKRAPDAHYPEFDRILALSGDTAIDEFVKIVSDSSPGISREFILRFKDQPIPPEFVISESGR